MDGLHLRCGVHGTRLCCEDFDVAIHPSLLACIVHEMSILGDRCRNEHCGAPSLDPRHAVHVQERVKACPVGGLPDAHINLVYNGHADGVQTELVGSRKSLNAVRDADEDSRRCVPKEATLSIDTSLVECNAYKETVAPWH